MTERVEVRVTWPKEIDGKVKQIVTVKLETGDSGEDRTVKRTIKGERADLQIKYVVEGGQRIMVHLHCQKDKETNEWGRMSGKPMGDFYRIDGYIVQCLKCKREWDMRGGF